jgi:hypothetical protein
MLMRSSMIAYQMIGEGVEERVFNLVWFCWGAEGIVNTYCPKL